MFDYRKATLDELERIWNQNIADHPEDPRWLRWKEAFISRNRSGQAVTFLVLQNGAPMGEVTLELSQSGNRAILADGTERGYLQALRIRPELEGQGHVSKMMAALEDYARQIGLTGLTIGVEAKETRNLAIYLHWGYRNFLMAEEDDGELVLFYEKRLNLKENTQCC